MSKLRWKALLHQLGESTKERKEALRLKENIRDLLLQNCWPPKNPDPAVHRKEGNTTKHLLPELGMEEDLQLDLTKEHWPVETPARHQALHRLVENKKVRLLSPFIIIIIFSFFFELLIYLLSLSLLFLFIGLFLHVMLFNTNKTVQVFFFFLLFSSSVPFKGSVERSLLPSAIFQKKVSCKCMKRACLNTR